MENKQTAIEWLLKEINERNGFIFTIHYEELFNQAKAMEKEQIMMAYNDGRVNQGLKQNKNSEQYYEETYGNI